MNKKNNYIMKIKHSFVKFIRYHFALGLYQQNSFNKKQLEVLKKEFTWLGNSINMKINHLPRLWKPIRKVNFKDFCTFYNNLDKYPFLSVFFKHYEILKLI